MLKDNSLCFKPELKLIINDIVSVIKFYKH